MSSVEIYHCKIASNILAVLFLGIGNWGGIDKCLGGGVNIRKRKVTLQNIKKTARNDTELGGGVVSQLGGKDPRGGCKIITAFLYRFIKMK